MRESRAEFIKSAEEQRRFYAEERRTNIRETTDAIFKEWWGPELTGLRRYFYLEFLPRYWARLQAGPVSLKRIKDVLAEDQGRISQLTGFFDKVGWLGAAGLVDVDFVLGPMQQTMRKVWFATEHLIRAEHQQGSGERLDPVYRLGFVWLARRSSEKDRSHADLLARMFQEPSIFNDSDMVGLRTAIEDDETRFLGYLEKPLAEAAEVREKNI